MGHSYGKSYDFAGMYAQVGQRVTHLRFPAQLTPLHPWNPSSSHNPTHFTILSTGVQTEVALDFCSVRIRGNGNHFGW